jgi:hypothetical protein
LTVNTHKLFTTSPTAENFVTRVVNCKSLRGFIVTAHWFDKATISFSIRHPYGAPESLTIFACNGATCESETGAPMYVSDVAQRLRRMIREAGDRR